MIRWYASRAAAKRGWGLRSPKGERTARMFGERLLLGVCHPEVLVNHATLHVVDVAHCADRHIDRLARDWIAHGVAPTKDGGRGVRSPWRRIRGGPRTHGPYYVQDPDVPHDAARSFDRAEARARRVVRR